MRLICPLSSSLGLVCTQHTPNPTKYTHKVYLRAADPLRQQKEADSISYPHPLKLQYWHNRSERATIAFLGGFDHTQSIHFLSNDVDMVEEAEEEQMQE